MTGRTVEYTLVTHVLCYSDPFLLTILELSKEEIRRTKDAKKILTSINVWVYTGEWYYIIGSLSTVGGWPCNCS